MAKAKSKIVAPAVTLADIIGAGVNGMHTSPDVHGPLVEAGLVEINPGDVNEAGEVATRATSEGFKSMNTATENTPVAPLPAAVSSAFVIEDDVAIPAITGRGRSGTVYPFDQLAVKQSFFIPNSTDKPNVAKSLASTVSSATARYAVNDPNGATKLNKAGESVPVTVETRKFVVRSVEESGVKGARVWRTA